MTRIFTITRFPGNDIKAKTNLPRDIAENIIRRWWFLVPVNTEWDGDQFATAITNYSSHVDAKIDAGFVRINHDAEEPIGPTTTSPAQP